MPEDDWAKVIMRHHWTHDALRDVWVGNDPVLKEVSGAMVASVRDDGDVVGRIGPGL